MYSLANRMILMGHSPLDRLPIVAAALLLAGKMQSDAPVDTKPQEDIRMDTQEAVHGVLDKIREFPDVDDLFSSFELEFPQSPDQSKKTDSSQTISPTDQPFLPSRRRKGQKPKREDWNSSCPPPPFLLLRLSNLDDLSGHSRYREEPINMICTEII